MTGGHIWRNMRQSYRQKVNGEKMTLRELLLFGRQNLSEAGVPDSEYDARVLLEYALGVTNSYYFLHGNDKITKEQQEAYTACIEKRKQRIPLQHIIGSAWFMGYEFFVNSDVLTPRFDTEILVDEVGKVLRRYAAGADKRDAELALLDVCTGSGCILLSLLAEHRDLKLRGVGIDISEKALAVAERNREHLGVAAEFLQSDLFENVQGCYDVIVSNPPYIATAELDGLMPEVLEHEPRIALDGKEDGLFFYRKILEQAGKFLKENAWICFEIGYDQGEALREMLLAQGYREVRIVKDLAGLDRVAIGQKI